MLLSPKNNKRTHAPDFMFPCWECCVSPRWSKQPTVAPVPGHRTATWTRQLCHPNCSQQEALLDQVPQVSIKMSSSRTSTLGNAALGFYRELCLWETKGSHEWWLFSHTISRIFQKYVYSHHTAVLGHFGSHSCLGLHGSLWHALACIVLWDPSGCFWLHRLSLASQKHTMHPKPILCAPNLHASNKITLGHVDLWWECKNIQWVPKKAAATLHIFCPGQLTVWVSSQGCPHASCGPSQKCWHQQISQLSLTPHSHWEVRYQGKLSLQNNL